MRRPAFYLVISALLFSGCTTATLQKSASPKVANLPARAHYVAMGSSFAAGAGIDPQIETPDKRCGRSEKSYARLLARSLDLSLTDVSCSGAKTQHLLAPWNEIPAQIDALTAQTRLVTITIGGNDVNYVASLMRLSCLGASSGKGSDSVEAICSRLRTYSASAAAQGEHVTAQSSIAADWVQLEANLRTLNTEIRRRSPDARIVFVDYVTMVPNGDMCIGVPLESQHAAEMRALAHRLADMTFQIAMAYGAEVLQASKLSAEHHACAAEPWSVGLLPPADAPRSAPYHPNAAGMAAIAEALAAKLGR